ncbi:VPS37B subunit of ESCRT-I a [Denticeps clupeoides]|uniref:VPS37 C-terminal domain-containing protein n=1 Tax=Denticeps clupeoides TaxID=299321 RepID=A0AAY4DZW5_9TELE|nr:vacuolar protein sorting-associated protein 37B [Denticeps clupeoides]
MSGFADKLSGYTLSQLNQLLEDDDALRQIVQGAEEVQEVQQNKEMTLASNRSLAEQNLSLQPRLDHQKSQLMQRYRSLQELFEGYQLRKSTLDQNSGNSSLDTLLALLQAEGAKIEEETENMADSFLDGDISLDSFIDDYQSKRTLAHLRRVKIDKLHEMVLRGPPASPALVQPPRLNQLPAASSPSPVPHPRRAPPPPPVRTPPANAPQPTVEFSYPSSIYPPVPPRLGQPLQSLNQGYPFMPQFPPALPDRPPPRLPPQAGFIVQ